jgi:uncharacterized protein
MVWVAICFVVSFGAAAFALRPAVAHTAAMWLGLALPYAALAGLAIFRLRAMSELKARFRYRSGDVAIGALSGGVLLVASWWGRSEFAPKDTPEAGWLRLIYDQVGDPEALQNSVVLTATLVIIAVLEELVWRGLVLSELTEKLGVRRAWPIAALLYALAQVPTLWTLATPEAGLNPLVIVAALGCGLVWSFMAARTRRLIPSMISHVMFTYFSAAQFRLPGL